jgi:ribosome-dependent ATPase
MNEAERCDRMSMMHAGKVLDSDAPHGAGGKAGRRHIWKMPLSATCWRPPVLTNPAAEDADHSTGQPPVTDSRRPGQEAAMRPACFQLQRLLSYSLARSRWSCAATRYVPRWRWLARSC